MSLDHKLHYPCAYCGKKLEASWKPRFLLMKGHWVAQECPVCHKRTDLSHESVLPCPHCEKIVLKKEKFCVECSQPVNVETERVAIPCSNEECDFAIYLPRNHKGDYTCPSCNKVISALHISSFMGPNAAPKLIELPSAAKLKADGLVVYHHATRRFSYKSRLTVSAGTYGLVFNDGDPQTVLEPGSYVLEGSSAKFVDRFDEAMDHDDVVFNRDIYCVARELPDLKWGATAKYIEARKDGAPDMECEIKSGGGLITLQVVDPALFLERVGYAQVKVDELSNSGDKNGWLKEMTLGVMNAEFGKVCASVFGGSYDQRRWVEYTIRIGEALAKAVEGKFREVGLSVLSVSCSSAKLEETEDSKTAYENYLNNVKSREEGRSQLSAAVETEFGWSANRVTLHVRNKLDLSAMADFSGKCRLKILYEEDLLKIPEVKVCAANGTPREAANFFRAKVQEHLGNRLAYLAQRAIDNGLISDLLDPHAYDQLTGDITQELNDHLRDSGLRVVQLTISIPEQIIPSETMKKHMAVGGKRQKLMAYAQRTLMLKTGKILVHTKDDATVNVQAVFGCHLKLRVVDEQAFFNTAEVKGFLQAENFVTPEAMTSYYTREITPRFADMTGRIVQAVVNQTNADIRELHRLNGILSDNLLPSLKERVQSLGLDIDSMDMVQPEIVERSANLDAWLKKHDLRSSDALEREIAKIKGDRIIFDAEESGRVDLGVAKTKNQTKKEMTDIQIDNMELDDQLAQKKEEISIRAAQRAEDQRRNQIEREYQDKLAKIRRDDAMEKLLDDINNTRDERAFNKLREEYKRRYLIDEMEIEQAIRVARIKQKAAIDNTVIDDQAAFQREIAQAEHKGIIAGIGRKLAAADLDWRKVLEDYARNLRRQIAADEREEKLLGAKNLAEVAQLEAKSEAEIAQIEARSESEVDLLGAKTGAEIAQLEGKTRAEINLLLATTQEKIRREENETFLLVGNAKIKLSNDEAELMEKIALYNENRERRIDNDLADRQERKAAMDFDRRMRERQAEIDYEMKRLQVEIEHTQTMRDKDDALRMAQIALQKEAFVLQKVIHEMDTKAEVDLARIASEEAIKKAEAEFSNQHLKTILEAEQKRLAEEVKRADELAKRADEQLKLLVDTILTQEKMRLEFAGHKDDNATEVAKILAEHSKAQQSEEYKQAVEKLIERTDEKLKKVHHDLKELKSAQQSTKDKLEKRIKDLSKLISNGGKDAGNQPGGQQGGRKGDPLADLSDLIDFFKLLFGAQKGNQPGNMSNLLSGILGGQSILGGLGGGQPSNYGPVFSTSHGNEDPLAPKLNMQSAGNVFNGTNDQNQPF